MRRNRKLTENPRTNSASLSNKNPVLLNPAIHQFLKEGGFSGQLTSEFKEIYLRPQQVMDAVLYSHYEKTVRPCIDLIDSLRKLGVEKDLSLPAIAVIGDQSSGKSSVLEALSGVSLPRGNGIVTRCPLELQLKEAKTEDVWKGTISYNGYTQELTDPSEVENEIREAQNKIAGQGVGISQNLISLQIEASNVPDLTLIDLPGIARVAVGNQPLNIGDQIKDLIRSFIKKQETINLVVVPCNVDIATTEALKMAQEVDPSGERTVGILTKPDLVDKGTEQTVVEIVQNQVVELKKGYMIVMCRGQKDINDRLTLQKALEKEMAFFKEHEHFRSLMDDGKATIPSLAKRLTTELVVHIRQSLPKLERELEDKLYKTAQELEEYGEGVPDSPSEKITFLIQKINEFGQHITSLASGEEPENFIQQERCYSKVRKEFQQWKAYLDHSLCQFQGQLKNKVSDFEKTYRGRELPGFINYKNFETIVRQQICKLEPAAILKLKKITEIVREAFLVIAFHNFNGVPNLFKAAKGKMETIRRQQEIDAEKQLRIQFKIENVVYSQDTIYSDNLIDSKAEEAFRNQGVPEKSVETMKHTLRTKGATIQEMTTHLETYYKIASDRLADQIPLVIRYYMMQEFANKLQTQMLEVLQNTQNIEEYLKEEETIAEKRKNLSDKLDRLTRAQQHLLEYV